MKSDRTSPDISGNPLFFKSQEPSIDRPLCIDIICYRGMPDSDLVAIGKALENAGIKNHRIWQSSLDYCGLRPIVWKLKCGGLTPNEEGPLAIIFLQPIGPHEHHLGWKHKPISADGNLSETLKSDGYYAILPRRIRVALRGKDPSCEVEFVNYYVDCDSMPHSSYIHNYDDILAGGEHVKFPATFHSIGGKNWDTLANICKAKLLPETISQPSLTPTK